MKITGIEAYLLSFPFPGTPLPRDAMLIRASSDDGLFGYAPGPATIAAKQIIDRIIAPFLTGRTLGLPDALRIAFQQGAGADAEVGKIYSAVEIALYDLAAKARNVPLSELIGGRVRDRIRLYGSGGTCASVEECAAEALRVRDLGFRAYKFRAARGEEDVSAARAVREALGADFDIMVDARAWRGHSFETVEHLTREMAREHVRWIEEPLAAGDHEGYARLKQMELAPLAAGEYEPNELRYLDLIESRAVDYVQMDLVSQGGYATARHLFPDIARAGLRFAFQSRGTALDLIAAAHLGVCWPESVVRWLEFPVPLADEILKQPPPIERGDLLVPRGAGLGIEIDESVIWRYPWVDGPRSYFNVEQPLANRRSIA